MNKEELKKEWEETKVSKNLKEFRRYVAELTGKNIETYQDYNEQVADFWLSKLDAYQSSILERITKYKKKEKSKPCNHEHSSGTSCSQLGFNLMILDDIITLIKEG